MGQKGPRPKLAFCEIDKLLVFVICFPELRWPRILVDRKKDQRKTATEQPAFCCSLTRRTSPVRGYPREKRWSWLIKKRTTHRGVTKSVITAFKVMAVSTG